MTTKSEPTQDEPTQDGPTKDEPAKDKSVKDQPTKDEPTKDESVKDEPTKDEPTEDEPAKDKPTEVVGTTPTPASDPFDPSNLRLDQDFVESAGVKKLLTTVPVRKPNPQEFIRVHPAPEYRMTVAIIELKEDREIYLLTPAIARELPGEFVMVTIFTAINRQGVVFLWPAKLPSPDGRVNEWNRSAQEAAEMAMKRWVRVKANMSLGAYEIFEAVNTIADPRWPELTFQELLRVALRDRLVDRLDHPVIKRLRGLS